MRSFNKNNPAFLLALLLSVSSCTSLKSIISCDRPSPPATAISYTRLSGATSLLDFEENVQVFTNPRNKQEMNVLGVESKSPSSSETIVLFNGTGGVIPDWPIDLFDDLAAEYNIVMFDYPGIGSTKTVQDSDFTFANIADNLNYILDNISGDYSDINSDKIHLIGWSLGALQALKAIDYLADDREIGQVILFSTKPGGEGTTPKGESFGNQSPCVSTVFDNLLSDAQADDWAIREIKLKKNLVKLMFPYKDQGVVRTSSTYSSCTASDKGKRLSVSVASDVKDSEKSILHTYIDNRKSGRWKKDVSNPVFLQERNVVSDWNQFSVLTRDHGEDNGNFSICKTNSVRDSEVSATCPDLSDKVKQVTVFHAKKDLFIQYKYGQALVNALNDASRRGVIAQIMLHRNAGHAYVLQESSDLQTKIASILSSH